MKTTKQKLFLFFKGMAMGAADVVPGVSGGTIAFITGIYEELLASISSVKPKVLLTLKNEGFAAAWNQINATFLLILFAGIAVSVVSLAQVISYLLETYPEKLWAFFFGLIIASSIFIGKQISKWNLPAIIAIIAGAIIAYIITIATPAEAPQTLWFAFISGAIAICAMILPGISGSFILLLLGSYAYVLGALKDFNLPVIIVFMLGCLIGLLSFSNVLSWTFRNYRNTTLALLTGFMIGSLNKVWPWKQTLETRIDSHGVEVPFLQKSILPTTYADLGMEPYLLLSILLMLAGFGVVFLLERLAGDDVQTQEVSS